VGLGNPGQAYAGTRHNAGFTVIKYLAKVHKVEFKSDRGTQALSAKVRMSGEGVILAMPLTFMNLSGVAVKLLVTKYKIDLDDLLIVCDDLDLDLGRLKIRPFGSSGGQRGIKSIIDSLGSDNFARLRIGIGRPLGRDATSHVLGNFNKAEKEDIKEALASAVDCCHLWVSAGIAECMNGFNQKNNKVKTV
jgi:PTH1 family peptidyl-tRNA hydrolase